MAAYNDLTQEQKDLLAAFERNMRGWVNGIISTGITQARALNAHYTASDGPGAIFASLDPGEVIPNTSGIAGAQDLDTTEWTALINGMDAFLTAYDTIQTRRYAALAAGPTAGL